MGSAQSSTRRVGQAEMHGSITAAGPRRIGLAAAEVVDAKRIALALSDGLKPHYDVLVLTRRDREDPRAKHPVAHPLHERRVALAPDDLFVHAARFVCTKRLAGDQLTVDLELEILERSVLR